MATGQGTATIQATIRTPAVPAHVYADLPGAKKGHKIAISELDDAQLQEVGTRWTEALMIAATEQRSNAERDDAIDDEDEGQGEEDSQLVPPF